MAQLIHQLSSLLVEKKYLYQVQELFDGEIGVVYFRKELRAWAQLLGFIHSHGQIQIVSEIDKIEAA